MKVTITVENGTQEVEVTRTLDDMWSGAGRTVGDIGPVLDLAVDDVRRACNVPNDDGEEVRVMRARTGLTMEQAAEDAGISHVTWRRIERGLPVREASLTAALNFLARKLHPVEATS